MKEKRSYIILITGIVLFPIIIGIIVSIKLPNGIETRNDWIGFFASYIGSIIGVLGVYFVMKIDQRQRESERRDDMFLKNFEIYKSISSALKQNLLTKIGDDITEIKKSDNWWLIDSMTKKKLEQLSSLFFYKDEKDGLLNTLSDYVFKNLSDELKLPMTHNERLTDQTIYYEDVPHEIVETVSDILYRYTVCDLEYDDIVEISITKLNLKNEFDKSIKISAYDKKMDIIYSKICDFNFSSELKSFQNGRNDLLNQAKNMAVEIDNRIEKILSY